jgi:hypothetical protein
MVTLGALVGTHVL